MEKRIYHQMVAMVNYRATFHSINIFNGLLSMIIIGGAILFALFFKKICKYLIGYSERIINSNIHNICLKKY